MKKDREFKKGEEVLLIEDTDFDEAKKGDCVILGSQYCDQGWYIAGVDSVIFEYEFEHIEAPEDK